MADLQDTIKKYLKQLGEDYKKGIRDNMELKRRNASHETERSLEAVIELDANMVRLKILGQPKSALYLERGWQPAPRQDSFIGVILDWMHDKGIGTGNLQEDVSVAAAIAGKIMKNGTELYQAGGYTKIYSDMVDESLKEVAERLQSIMVGNVYQTNEELNAKK